MHVSVVLPTYNERETVCGVIDGARRQLGEHGHDVEIVVVDDDSPDDTHAHVREQYADAPVRVIRRREESGLASAVACGFREARGDQYVVMDADGQHPPATLPALVDVLVAGGDLAVGSRFAQGGGIKADWPLERRVISRCATWLAGWQVPAARRLSDPMSGLFAVDAQVVDPYADQLAAPGFKILLEVMARCPIDSVREVGYEFHSRQGGESGLTSGEYLRFVRHLARLSVAGRTPNTRTPQGIDP